MHLPSGGGALCNLCSQLRSHTAVRFKLPVVLRIVLQAVLEVDWLGRDCAIAHAHAQMNLRVVACLTAAAYTSLQLFVAPASCDRHACWATFPQIMTAVTASIDEVERAGGGSGREAAR